MAMLSDRELIRLAKEKEIVSPFVEENCEGATINLRLDRKARKYISTSPIVLGDEVQIEAYKDIDFLNDVFYLQPKESILIQTYEFIRVPEDLSGILFDRYSIKSLGLQISPAGYLNPGYRGQIGLVLMNNATVPIRIVPGIKICQLAFNELTSTPIKPYEKQDAKYMDARDVSISKLHLDKEIQDFLKSKGIQNVSNDLAKDLGDHLMQHVRKSARRLADILRSEEGSDKGEQST